MGVNEGKGEDSLVRMYLVKRSSKFTRTGIFLFALCPLSLTQIVVRCFDKLRGDLFKYKSPPAVFSSQCILSLINGRRQISLCLLSFKLLLGSRCHITENPPRHLVHIGFWLGIGQNVQKMAIFGPK